MGKQRAALEGGKKRDSGTKVVRYLGASMSPLFTTLDQLRIEPVEFKDVCRGDILVFDHPTKAVHVVHRTVDVEADFIRTRGDNLSASDPYTLTELDELYRVVGVLREGQLHAVLNGPKGYRYAARQHRRLALRQNLRQPLLLILLALNSMMPALLHKLLRKRLRVIEKRVAGSSTQLLLLGKRLVGKRTSGEVEWTLTPPFDRLLSTQSLP